MCQEWGDMSTLGLLYAGLVQVQSRCCHQTFEYATCSCQDIAGKLFIWHPHARETVKDYVHGRNSKLIFIPVSVPFLLKGFQLVIISSQIVLPFFMRFYPVELKIFKMSRPISGFGCRNEFLISPKSRTIGQHLTINISKNYSKIW